MLHPRSSRRPCAPPLVLLIVASFVASACGASPSASPDASWSDGGLVLDDGGAPPPVDGGSTPPTDGGLPLVDAGPTDAGVDGGSTATVCEALSGAPLRETGGMVTGLLSGSSQLDDHGCSAGGAGPEAIHPLRVTSATGVTLDVSAGADVVVAIRRACDDPASQLACSFTLGVEAHRGTLRAALPPGDYAVIVDAVSAPIEPVPYTLELRTFTPIAAHATCDAPARLEPGATVLGDTREGGDVGSACAPFGGPQLFYELTLPARTRARIQAQPTAPWGAFVRVIEDCFARRCLATGAPTAVGEPATAVHTNPTDLAMPLRIAVGSDHPGGAGPFALSAVVESLDAAPGNAECSAATPVTAGSHLVGEDAARATTRSSCGLSSDGAALFYRVRVAPGETLRVDASPMGEPWDPVIDLVDSCSATTCRAASNRYPEGWPERLVYTNRDAVERDLVIAVASADPRIVGRFDLRIERVARPANTTCEAAMPVTAGVIPLQDASVATEVPATLCRETDTGGVLYYRVRVGAGETLTASAAPSGAFFNIGMRLLDACGASECLASEIGSPDRALTYTNETASAREVVLAVGARTTTGAGTFDLSIGLWRAPGYELGTAASACDDMSASRSLGVVAYGQHSAPQPLPFPFALFGEPQGWIAAASHGHAMVYPMLPQALPIYARSTNRALPASIEPSRMLAALWDELTARPDGTTDVRMATFGVAPHRHTTIEWRDWTFAADPTARLRFQLKLFEGTDRIEVHYCELTAGADATRASGGSATVGVEDASQRFGVQHAFDTPGAVQVRAAVVLTPSAR